MKLGNTEEAPTAAGGFLRNRSSGLPVALVAVAMLYAVLVPTLLRRAPDRVRSEIEGIIEPARRVARTRQANLAVEVSAYRAYVISHDARLLDRARDARTRTEESGTELLALARRVGGRMAVESKPGHGTTFRFSVPVAATVRAHSS